MSIENPPSVHRWTRRAILAPGVGGTAAVLYRISPSFWKAYVSDGRRPILPAPERPNPRNWPEKGLHAAWIGHSTVLLKIDGFTILTDPIFSDRAGISVGPVTLGVKRLVYPPLLPQELPAVDLILLSHAHMDHFDLPSLRQLESRKTTVVTAAYTADLLRTERYARVREMRWGTDVRIGPARVRAFEVKHWGARLRNDLYRGYNGYLVEVGRTRVLFAGDTGFTDRFRQVRAWGRPDLAIMPIGCYNPYLRNHCSPEEAWRMAEHCGSERIFPVHHDTFQLSREPLQEPMERLLAAAGGRCVAIRQIGQEFHL